LQADRRMRCSSWGLHNQSRNNRHVIPTWRCDFASSHEECKCDEAIAPWRCSDPHFDVNNRPTNRHSMPSLQLFTPAAFCLLTWPRIPNPSLNTCQPPYHEKIPSPARIEESTPSMTVHRKQLSLIGNPNLETDGCHSLLRNLRQNEVRLRF
jgi:hypothetical protein